MKRAYCVGALFFSVKPKSIEYSEFLLPFELLLQDVKQENLYSEDLSFNELLESALSSYESFSSERSPSENLTASEFKALRHLSKSKYFVIQKADRVLPS